VDGYRGNSNTATHPGDGVDVSGWFARIARSGAGPVALVLVVGLGASSVAATVLHGSQRVAAAQAMDRRTAAMREQVTAEAERYVDAVRATAAALGAPPALTRAGFLAATAPMPAMGLHGATSVVFLASATDVPAAQAYWRGRGAPDLSLAPVGAGPEHIFGVFGRSLDGGRAPVTGVDVTQYGPPAEALHEARRTGRVAVSSAYPLMRDRDLPQERRQLSFVLAAPVVDGAGAPRGWVMMGLRGQDFIRGTLRQAALDLIDVRLVATALNGDQVQVAGLRGGGRRPDLHRQAEVPVAQRRWLLRTDATAAALPGGHTLTDVAGAAAGAALTLLLAALVLVLTRARRRAEARVGAATARMAAANAELARNLAWREAVQAELQGARDELAAQKRYLTQVMDSIDVAVTTYDPEGRVVHRNRAARDLAVPDGSLVPRALAGEAVRAHPATAGEGRPRHLLVDALPLRDPRGAVTCAVEVTALREREAELHAFAGVVAHDLKSPLTAITGYAGIAAECLQAEPADLDTARFTVDRLVASSARMRRLIDDLLTYATARDIALRVAATDLRAVVDRVVTGRLAEPRPADVPAPEIYVGPLPAVQADPVLLGQLVENLIGNALRYSPPGQPARVDVTAQEHEPGWVRVEVADRGIGIPAGQHVAIFNSFHRAHPAAGVSGNGLGLAICQRIVQRHGGGIDACDNPGGGARFRFTLPAGAPAARPVSPALDPA
jgi:signal transduction histidine kinase